MNSASDISPEAMENSGAHTIAFYYPVIIH